MTLRHGRLDVSATVQEIINLAMTVCKEFEDHMTIVCEEFYEYRKKLDARKRLNSPDAYRSSTHPRAGRTTCSTKRRPTWIPPAKKRSKSAQRTAGAASGLSQLPE
jgi:hypothetical protein